MNLDACFTDAHPKAHDCIAVNASDTLNGADAGTLAQHGNRHRFLFGCEIIAITFSLLTLLLTEIRFESTYLLTKMKNKVGRPKIGKQNAKGELFAARFTPPEAKVIQAAIAKSPHSKSDWIRKALLSVAQSDKPVS